MGWGMLLINYTAMKKNFDSWNERKKKIEERKPHHYREGEVWWCSLGVNVGWEQDGKGYNSERPVVIIKGFKKDLLLSVAIIGRKKEGLYYYYLGRITDRDSTAVLSQIRLIDTRRLTKRMGVLKTRVFWELKDKIEQLIFGRKLFCPCKCRGGPEGISLPLHFVKEGSEDLH